MGVYVADTGSGVRLGSSCVVPGVCKGVSGVPPAVRKDVSFGVVASSCNLGL